MLHYILYTQIQKDDDDDIPDETDVRLADERADNKDVQSSMSGGNNNDPAQSKLVKDILSRQAEQAAQVS